MTRRVKTIYRILDDHEQRTYSHEADLSQSMVYALLLCLSDSELTDAFFHYRDNRNIRSRIESLISRRISETGHSNYIDLVERLYDALPNAKWHEYQRLRRFLSGTIRSFPKPFIRRFFDRFRNGEKYGDRWKAYSVVEQIWSAEIEEILWKEFENEPNEMCFRILMKKGDLGRFAVHVKALWTNDSVPWWVKKALLQHFATRNFNVLRFLKTKAPLSFLYAVVIAQRKLPAKQVLNIVSSASSEREHGFAIWCLGKLGMWKELEELNARLPALEKKLTRAKLRDLGIRMVR